MGNEQPSELSSSVGFSYVDSYSDKFNRARHVSRLTKSFGERNTRTIVYFAQLFVFVAIMVALGYLLPRFGITPNTFTILLPSLGIGFILNYLIFSKFLVTYFNRRARINFGPPTAVDVRMDDDSLTIRDGAICISYGWECARRLASVREGLFFSMGPYSVLIPARAFPARSDLQSAVRFALSRFSPEARERSLADASLKELA